PAPPRRPPGRGIDRIAGSEIEGHVNPTAPLRGERDRTLGDRRDAFAIDVLHRENVDPGRADLALLLLVEITNADEDGIGRSHRGRRADGRELLWLPGAQGRTA